MSSKHMSQSFRDILENTLLINGLCQTSLIQQKQYQPPPPPPPPPPLERTESTATAVVNPVAARFAELERHLALTKVENCALLEQQLQTRQRELLLFNEEKKRRQQLDQEIRLRERVVQENIKLRRPPSTTTTTTTTTESRKAAVQTRPLTRYLPVRESNFDLRQHVETSGHRADEPQVQLNATSCRGYLLKMGGQTFKTWNKRWFVFDRVKRTLSYYADKHEAKLRGTIYFQSINEVYVDHMRSIKSPDAKATFVVKTHDRNFFLVASSPELMRIWVEVIFTGAEGYLEFND